MPPLIAMSHDDIIRRFINRGNCILIRTEGLLFPFVVQNGFIIKVIYY